VLLLDTHTWLWGVEDSTRLGRRARQLLASAGRQDALRISPVSIFEVTALHTRGRLRLGHSAEQWVREALAQEGLRLAELTPGIATDAGSLPRNALPDPIDRLLVATSRQLGATLVTADTRILAYASATSMVRVQNAST
jgi:PIN domain nuclease of toxin-antitoxin system